MPALDPFSALSRPMLPFDSQPSNPLPFAATLQPIDQNANPPLPKLPKPKRVNAAPIPYPVPVYSHSRHSSLALPNSESIIHQPLVVGSDEWMKQRVNDCVDTATGELDLKNLGLTSLSTEIAGLQNLVTLPASFSPRPSTHIHSPGNNLGSPTATAESSRSPSALPRSSVSSRTFSRISSAPASSTFFNNLQNETGSHENTNRGTGRNPLAVRTARGPSALSAPMKLGAQRPTLGRSKTNAAIAFEAPPTSLSVYAANNSLTSLPSALFEITNLTLLSLRGNHLTSLPAAIGELHNLTDLNISNNRITELPSSILNLHRLTSLALFPNPFYRWSHKGDNNSVIAATAPSGRLLGPVKRATQSVPRLYDLCLQVLISPRAPASLPPLLDSYVWDAPAKGQRHALHDVELLHSLIPCVSIGDLTVVLQALKTASMAHSRSRKNKRGMANLSPDSFPTSTRPFPPDDASSNPYYYPCPSPRHLEYDVASDARPNRHLFVHSAEERLEWRKVLGQEVPIKWKGCSPGCLNFLEEEEVDDWTLSEEDE